MEMGCIGFLVGALVAIVFFGSGVCIGRADKTESDRDRGECSCHPVADRDHRSVVRHTPEEMSVVLYNLRMGASRYEKEVVDQIIEKIEGGIEE